MTFASQQIDAIVPYLKDKKDFGLASVLTMFSIEHIMIAIVVIYSYFMNQDPYWIRIFRQRRLYKMHLERKDKEL